MGMEKSRYLQWNEESDKSGKHIGRTSQIRRMYWGISRNVAQEAKKKGVFLR